MGIYVSISESSATYLIERLEKQVADLNEAIDARWDQIEKYAKTTRDLRELNDSLYDKINDLQRRNDALSSGYCHREHIGEAQSKIREIKTVRAVMNLGLKESKDLVDAAYADGRLTK